MPTDTHSRVVIVTGGSQNIGLAIAQRFVESGAIVISADRSSPEDDRIEFMQTDITSEAQVVALDGPRLLIEHTGGERDGAAGVVADHQSDEERDAVPVRLHTAPAQDSELDEPRHEERHVDRVDGERVDQIEQ